MRIFLKTLQGDRTPCGIAEQRRRRPTRSRRRRAHVGHGVRITDLDCMLAQAAAALHQLQRGLPELQLLLAGPGAAPGAPPALSRERRAAPAAALPAVTGGRSSQLPEGRAPNWRP